MKRFTKLSLAMMIGLSLTACGKKTSDEHFQAAKTMLANNQLDSAVIELKSALQKDPERGEIRLALADIYAGAGLLDDAVKEYQRAISYSNDHLAFIQRYINVLYLNGNYSEILTLLDEKTTYSQPLADYLQFYKALAEAELGSNDNASALFKQLAGSAQADISAFAQAFELLAQNELSQAKLLLEGINTDSALYLQSVYLRSKIALTENDLNNAIVLLQQYSKAYPFQLLPQLLLAQSLVKTGQLTEADALLKPLLKKVPQQPLVNYFSAVIAYENAQYEQARVFIDTAISNGVNSPQARILGALIAVNLKLDNVALNHLETAKDALQVYPPAQRLYAVLLLKAGNTEAAQRLLASGDNINTDLQLLSATAFELTKQGSVAAAQNLLEQYKPNTPLTANELTTLGAVQLQMSGQRGTAINSLEQALKLDPAADQARVMLLSAYLGERNYTKAMALADEWIATEQHKLAGHNMKAYVAIISEQLPVADENIKVVLAQEPKNSLARLLQASLAAAQNELEQAATLFQALLDDEPTNVQALEQYLAFSLGTGDTSDVAARARKAHDIEPANNAITLLLAGIKHQEKDYKETLNLLNKMDVPARQRSNRQWAYLIDTQLRENNPAQALQTAQEWYSIQPNSSFAAQAYLQTLYANKDLVAALRIVEQLLAEQPRHLRFINIKLQILDESQQDQQIIEYSKTLPPELQQRPEILQVNGKALARLKQYPEAEKALMQSYKLQPNATTVIFLAELYNRTNRSDDGVKLLEQHIANQGDSPALQAMLAQLSLANNTARAMLAYEQMLQKQPDNVLALNNLAWLKLENNDLAGALVLAEKAYALKPDNADVSDTYAKVLLDSNKAEQAKTILKAALDQRPNDTQIQLHYAEALAKSGETEKARNLLSQLEKQTELAEQVAKLKTTLGL